MKVISGLAHLAFSNGARVEPMAASALQIVPVYTIANASTGNVVVALDRDDSNVLPLSCEPKYWRVSVNAVPARSLAPPTLARLFTEMPARAAGASFWFPTLNADGRPLVRSAFRQHSEG